MKKIVIFGGGTISHVRNHLALCAPAYGTTARRLQCLFNERRSNYIVELALTKMADPMSDMETSEDVKHRLEHLIVDPDVRCIVFNCALVDYNGQVGTITSGKHAERLKTSETIAIPMGLSAAEKLIGMIRKQRKDIFVIGFKTTTGASPMEQYGAGLKLLKTNSLNLVLANDTVTRRNVIIAPEETQYGATFARDAALAELVTMTLSRMTNTFTRSTVVPGEAVPWSSESVPDNLRKVVNFCIKKGAYKPVLGKTAGHFAVKLDEGSILTSIRKSNFNELAETGMVRVDSSGEDTVIAHGFKPSVGGQSQRIIFKEHPELDCIVHFHCPPKDGAVVPYRQQWPNECGSHQCGKNTSDGLKPVDLGDGHSLKVVMLDNHGPNIVFSRDTPAEKVMAFIDRTFELGSKTGGLIPDFAQ